MKIGLLALLLHRIQKNSPRILIQQEFESNSSGEVSWDCPICNIGRFKNICEGCGVDRRVVNVAENELAPLFEKVEATFAACVKSNEERGSFTESPNCRAKLYRQIECVIKESRNSSWKLQHSVSCLLKSAFKGERNIKFKTGTANVDTVGLFAVLVNRLRTNGYLGIQKPSFSPVHETLPCNFTSHKFEVDQLSENFLRKHEAFFSDLATILATGISEFEWVKNVAMVKQIKVFQSQGVQIEMPIELLRTKIRDLNILCESIDEHSAAVVEALLVMVTSLEKLENDEDVRVDIPLGYDDLEGYDEDEKTSGILSSNSIPTTCPTDIPQKIIKVSSNTEGSQNGGMQTANTRTSPLESLSSINTSANQNESNGPKVDSLPETCSMHSKKLIAFSTEIANMLLNLPPDSDKWDSVSRNLESLFETRTQAALMQEAIELMRVGIFDEDVIISTVSIQADSLVATTVHEIVLNYTSMTANSPDIDRERRPHDAIEPAVSNRNYYKVVCAEGAVVRRDIELDSDRVKVLPVGDVIEVFKIEENSMGILRAHIADGWVTVRADEDEPILELCSFPPQPSPMPNPSPPGVIIINDLSRFSETVEVPGRPLTVVYFYSRPNQSRDEKKFKPRYDAMALENPNVTFAEVDAESAEIIAYKAGIRCLPTYKFYKNGELKETHAQEIKTEQKLKEIIDKYI